MSNNVIEIDGRKSIIVNPNLTPNIGLYLTAKYKGREFPATVVYGLGLPNEEKVDIALLRFDRDDRRIVRGNLNHILVFTHIGSKGQYRAVGIDNFPNVQEKDIRWFRLGEPKIVVSSSADEAIHSMNEYDREIRELSQNSDELLKMISHSMRN